MALHPKVKDRLALIERIVIETQEPGVRIIDKTGPLANPADRDHCIQYMVAVPLIFGRLTAADYEDAIASDPRIDVLRAKMEVKENTVFTKEYYERDKRHIGNALHIFFSDGSPKLEIRIDFPIGHRKRRAEGMPVLVRSSRTRWPRTFRKGRPDAIKALFARKDFDTIPVNEFMASLVANWRERRDDRRRGHLEARLDDGANELGVELDESQRRHAVALRRMLRERNEHVNLTSIVSPEGILTLHMLDSLSVAPHLGERATHYRRGHGRRFSGNSAGRGLPAARVHAHRRHAEEDPLRRRERRGARHPQCAGARGARREFPWREGLRRGHRCARWACWPMFYITPARCSARTAGCSR